MSVEPRVTVGIRLSTPPHGLGAARSCRASLGERRRQIQGGHGAVWSLLILFPILIVSLFSEAFHQSCSMAHSLSVLTPKSSP